MRTWCAVLCAAAVVSLGSTASAAVLLGPSLDMKAEVGNPGDSTVTITIHTGWKEYKDKIVIVIDFPHVTINSLKGVGYESYENPDLTGDALLTTIYGLDLDPNGTSLAMTGLDATTAATFSFTDERFIGNSGTEYLGTALGPVMLSELPALMPGYDLSVFQGDPSSIVYVFRTTVPTSDFAAVPESSTLALAAMGMLSLAVYGWRSRRRAAIA